MKMLMFLHNYLFFQATNAAKTSRDIQNISNDRIQYVTMRSDMVKYDCDDCTGKCNAAHNAELAKVEEGLLDCLSGKIPPPTPPTPTTSSTTTSPTPSSTTTTAQPSVETTTSDEWFQSCRYLFGPLYDTDNCNMIDEFYVCKQAFIMVQ